MVKGPDVLCDVLEEVAQDEPIFVLLTGPSRGYVCQRLEKAGIPYVHHNIPNPDLLIPYYRALDLYLITSRAEGGPKPLLEAMACGIPVVTTPVGMVVDLVKDGQEALVGDGDDLTQKCLQALGDEELRTQLAMKGRESIGALDWRTIARRYEEELYRVLPG